MVAWVSVQARSLRSRAAADGVAGAEEGAAEADRVPDDVVAALLAAVVDVARRAAAARAAGVEHRRQTQQAAGAQQPRRSNRSDMFPPLASPG